MTRETDSNLRRAVGVPEPIEDGDIVGCCVAVAIALSLVVLVIVAIVS